MKLFSLGRAERIKSHATFDELFQNGTAVYGQMFKIMYVFAGYNEKYPVQAAFIVPRRVIRNAFMRNRIRRLVKEAYRKNKEIIYNKALSVKKGVKIAIVFTGTSQPSYAETEEKIIVILQRLIQEQGFIQ